MTTVIVTNKFIITRPALADMQEFLAAVKNSKPILQNWVTPPDTEEKYIAYLKQADSSGTESFFIKITNTDNTANALAGVININEIVYKSLKSGYLGFYSFAPQQRTGIMSAALMHIINFVFYNLGLHRLEANVQPNNIASINFIKKNNFCEEGFSKKYLKVAGLWRDHIRFAINKEMLEQLYISNANATRSPWQADFNISDKHLHSLCEQIAKQKFNSIKKIAEGWDNWVYLADNKIIFRVPRRYIGIALFSRENNILNFLNGKLDLQIPNPKYSGFGDKYFPYQIQGYAQVPGTSCIEKPIDLSTRSKSIIHFAKFLKKLHSIPLIDLYAADIEPTVFNRCDFPVISKNFLQRLDKLQKDKVLKDINIEKFLVLHAKAKDAIKNLCEKCLVHGDLYSRHLLFSDNQLSGVIDWGDTGINNPAVDLAAIYSFFPPDCHAEFFKNYGEVNQNCKDYAKFLGVYTTINFLDYALNTKNSKIESETKMSLKMQG